MLNKKVTIILVCYNQASYLRDALNSALNQTYNNIQLIVADDHSTDGSAELLQQLSEENGFVFLTSEKNAGLNNNILRVLPLVKGEYVSILASDDYIALDKIENQVTFLNQTGNDGVYATGYTVKGAEKKLIKLNSVFTSNDQVKIFDYVCRFDWGAPLLQSGLFTQALISDLIPLWKDYKSDDWAFLIKAFDNYKIGFLDKPFFYYRLHGDNYHQRYWVTYPMRVDIASRLVPEKYRLKTLSNIMLSQGTYLLNDKKIFAAIKFFISSLIFNFSFYSLAIMAKASVSFLNNIFAGKPGKNQ